MTRKTKTRAAKDAQTRKDAGTERRKRVAISKDAQRACGLKNGINLLIHSFMRAIQAREAAAQGLTPAQELEMREAREDAEVQAAIDRINARAGVRWDREGFDGSTAPARSLIVAPEHTIKEWRRVGRDRWNWQHGDVLALVRVDRDLWELRYFHAAGPQADLDTKNRFSGRLLSPGLDLATLRRVVTHWLKQNGTDPAAWGTFGPKTGATAAL